MVSFSRMRNRPRGAAPGQGVRPAVEPRAARLVPHATSASARPRPWPIIIGRVSGEFSGRHLVGLIRSLTAAIDAKDPHTFGHSERVARIALELGREMGLPQEQLGDVYLAGLLHDIGKVGIRDAVLGKAGPLTAEETEHIRQHVTIGYQMLVGVPPLKHLLPGVLYHHERYDGKGYPHGLRGEIIPLLGRVLAVADSYDAMSTDRPYRPRLPGSRVEEVLRDGAGKQWDARVIAAFLHCRQQGLTSRLRMSGAAPARRCA